MNESARCAENARSRAWPPERGWKSEKKNHHFYALGGVFRRKCICERSGCAAEEPTGVGRRQMAEQSDPFRLQKFAGSCKTSASRNEFAPDFPAPSKAACALVLIRFAVWRDLDESVAANIALCIRQMSRLTGDRRAIFNLPATERLISSLLSPPVLQRDADRVSSAAADIPLMPNQHKLPVRHQTKNVSTRSHDNR